MWLKVGIQHSIRRQYVFICDIMCALKSHYSFTILKYLPSSINDTANSIIEFAFLVSIISPTTRHRHRWNFDNNYCFRDYFFTLFLKLLCKSHCDNNS